MTMVLQRKIGSARGTLQLRWRAMELVVAEGKGEGKPTEE